MLFDMDDAGRSALDVYTPIRHAVRVLLPDVAPDHRVFILDDAAVAMSMRWARVPLWLQREVYERLQIIHDVNQHQGKLYNKTYCYHGPATLYHPRCKRCNWIRAYLPE